jgi:hypothetical protein
MQPVFSCGVFYGSLSFKNYPLNANHNIVRGSMIQHGIKGTEPNILNPLVAKLSLMYNRNNTLKYFLAEP